MKYLAFAGSLLCSALTCSLVLEKGTRVWTDSPHPVPAFLILVFFICVLPVGLAALLWVDRRIAPKVRQLA